MTRFLRDMIAIPSESCDEKRVIHRIKEEMEKVGFDRVEIDPMGNILGTIGHGRHLIALDAHIDTSYESGIYLLYGICYGDDAKCRQARICLSRREADEGYDAFHSF